MTLPRESIEDLRRRVQGQIRRLEPVEALAVAADGALIVDLRSYDERDRSGVIPGSVHIPRSVLEWRLDPDSPYRNSAVADLERRLILVCADGYSSSLAVTSLERLGFVGVGDVVGGFNGWAAAGLETCPAPPRPEGLAGMSPPAGRGADGL